MGIESSQARARDDFRSAFRWALLAPSAANLAPVPGRLMFTADCDVTIVGDDLVAVTLPVKAGVEYDWSPLRVTAVSAGSCIACFTDASLA